jgi:predicted transcriptional regulator
MPSTPGTAVTTTAGAPSAGPDAAGPDTAGHDTARPDATRPEAELSGAVEHLGSALVGAAFPRLPARVFAALLASETGRLTAAEIAALLHVSPAGVSGAVRYLDVVRMVRRERERGSRRDVYVVMDDGWHEVLLQQDQVYAPIVTALAAARDTVGAGTGAGKRLQLSVEFLQFLTAEMEGIARRWEEYQAARDPLDSPRADRG